MYKGTSADVYREMYDTPQDELGFESQIITRQESDVYSQDVDVDVPQGPAQDSVDADEAARREERAAKERETLMLLNMWKFAPSEGSSE
jgi:hypothetical protein